MHRLSNSVIVGLAFAISSVGQLHAQTTSEIIEACAQGGAAVYRVKTSTYNAETLARADYYRFCRVERDWEKLSSSDQQSFGASYAGYGGSFSQGGSSGSESEKYTSFCNEGDSQLASSSISTGEIEDIRGGVDAYMLACLELADDGVKMVTDLPEAPDESLVVTFSTIVADRAIESVSITNGSCELDGVVVNGNLTNPRVFTNDSAEIVCKRISKPARSTVEAPQTTFLDLS